MVVKNAIIFRNQLELVQQVWNQTEASIRETLLVKHTVAEVSTWYSILDRGSIRQQRIREVTDKHKDKWQIY
jgi:transcriptional regulator of nitric oxide reductase